MGSRDRSNGRHRTWILPPAGGGRLQYCACVSIAWATKEQRGGSKTEASEREDTHSTSRLRRGYIAGPIHEHRIGTQRLPNIDFDQQCWICWNRSFWKGIVSFPSKWVCRFLLKLPSRLWIQITPLPSCLQECSSRLCSKEAESTAVACWMFRPLLECIHCLLTRYTQHRSDSWTLCLSDWPTKFDIRLTFRYFVLDL